MLIKCCKLFMLNAQQVGIRACRIASYHRLAASLWKRRPTWYTTGTGGYRGVATYVNTDSSLPYKLEDYPPERIRNFCIIAHVDHGKSTLADRLLELTGTISSATKNAQVLDKLQVERERGITVKAQTVSMFYKYAGEEYLLNLVDTPGHVDFTYEVSRSLNACDGVILLVDANQGVQAQTVANFYLAFEKELTMIPILNKIDLKHADPELVANQLSTLFDINSEDILKISAKLGTGIEQVLTAVVKKIPPPRCDSTGPFRALLFDSWYDRHKGTISLIAVKDGCVSVGNSIIYHHTGNQYVIKELGILHPEECAVTSLYPGQIGYIACNMKSPKEAHVGDTICAPGSQAVPFPGFAHPKSMVFAGLYPMDQSELPKLRSALDKLLLNDSSVAAAVDSSPALGQGWRLGFLGLLHMDVFAQRLEQEYNAEVILTTPTVPFKARLRGEQAKLIKKYGSDEITINNPIRFPDQNTVEEFLEPFVTGTLILPDIYMGDVLSLCLEKRGVQLDARNLDADRVLLKFRLPLNEIVVDFFDRLKSITSGYASFDYEDAGYAKTHLVKISILLNDKPVDELCFITHVSQARSMGKHVCSRLKETIPRQQFKIAIQAAIGSKILAREDIKPFRKDVTAKLYGGDVTRRQKLLAHQAAGKKRMKLIGNIEIPRDTFVKVLRR